MKYNTRSQSAKLKERINAFEVKANKLPFNSPEWLAAQQRLDELRDEYEDKL